MIGASKILTVSYGTFSCTLEGFDDPFNTMRAIAEYFRDLAAEDRYFGAEPPQPDAAMLHRIAEREIHRRVEAKVQDNGVILRAEGSSTPSLAQPEPVAPAPAVMTAEMSEAVAESVVAKLSRLRATAAPQIADVEEEPAASPDEALAQFMAEPAVAAAPEPVKAAPKPAPKPKPAAAPRAEAAKPAPKPAPKPKAEKPVVVVAPEPAPAVEEAAIAAVMAATAAQEPVDAAPAAAINLPDDLASLLSDDAARDLSAALSDDPVIGAPTDVVPVVEDALPEDVAEAQPEALPEAEDDLPEDLAAVLAGVAESAEVLPEDPGVEDTLSDDLPEGLAAALADPVETVEAAAADELPDDLAAVLAQVAPAAEAGDESEDQDTTAAVLAALNTEPAAGAAPAEETPIAGLAEALAITQPASSEKVQRARARVIKIRRAEAPAPEPEPEEPRKRLEGRADETAVTRLIAQTNSEMEGPEAKRRLSAISHLKAAVAATVAERLSRGKPIGPTESTRAEPYRDDLARAVRPRRPESANAPERPAPLVLVSEQRIDRPAPVAVPDPEPVASTPVQPAPVAPPAVAPAAVAPVRPRRVAASAAPQVLIEDEEDEDDEDGNIFTDTRGFLEFADRLGVRSLPDLMEAAAAYTDAVEGSPSFSRPHLIRHLTAARGDDLPREDSLRAFGRLLREGRIEKIKRGQFAVSQNSRFLAEARRMNG